MPELEVSKEDIHAAVLHFRSHGKMTPGINALQTYIGGGSQNRVKRLRDEVILELDNGLGLSGEMPEGLKTLWTTIQAQTAKESEAVQLKTDEALAKLQDQLQCMKDARDHQEKLYNQAASELTAAHEEIESLNTQLVDRNLDVRELETKLEAQDKQASSTKAQFDEYKALSAEYGKTSALRESGYHEQIQSLESKLLLLTQSYDQLVKKQLQQSESHQVESDKTLHVISDELSNIGEIIELSAKDNNSRDESHDIRINSLMEIFSKVDKGLSDSERHIMEQVLMIPELVDGLKD
ncbi:MAG: hypothetical protein QM500_11390, partial [Methylococcales bacterium]